MSKWIYLKIIIIYGLLNCCTSEYNKLQENSILYAEREGVANCMTYLYFLKDNTVVQKSICFGMTTNYGTYDIKHEFINIYWRIPGKKENGLQSNDSIIHDIAKLKKYEDRIGHIYKEIDYYKNGDTLSNTIVYNAYDDETKCLEYRTKTDYSDLTFLTRRYTKQEMFKYENSLNSIEKSKKFSLSKDYYPNQQNLNLDTPIVFDRKYTMGIPLTTSYLFYKDTLMVQFHEWSDVGVKCIQYFKKEAYIDIYKQITEKITITKGQPINTVGEITSKKENQFKRIWDNENEHLELHLYLYDNLRIRLINYWK